MASGTLLIRPRIKYEYLYNEKLSFGAIVSFYLKNILDSEGDIYKGFMLSPIGRYYFKHNAGNGWYAQVKLNVGYFKEKLCYYGRNDETLFKDGASFVSVGGGANIGYQTSIKNSRWMIDVNIGLKAVSSKSEATYESSFNDIQQPGSSLDTNLSLCYHF